MPGLARLFVFALLVRTVFVWSLGDRFHDPAVFALANLTSALVHGRWPAEGLGPAPMVPLLLAAGRALLGDHFRIAARGLLMLVGLASVLLTALLAAAHTDPRSRDRALLLAACSPMLVLSSGSLSLPGVATALLLATMVLAVRLAERPRAARALAFSAVAVAAAFANPINLAPLGAILSWLAWRVWRKGGRRAFAVALVAAACVAAATAATSGSGVTAQREDREQQVIGEALTTLGESAEHPQPAMRVGADTERTLASNAMRFFFPLSGRERSLHPLQRAGAAFAGAFYFLPMLVLAWLGASSRRTPFALRALLLAVIGAAFVGGAAHGSVREARVLATPLMIALAVWGWPVVRAHLAPRARGRAPSAVMGAAFALGSALFAITAAGLLVPLRNPEVYAERAASAWGRLKMTEAELAQVAAMPFDDRRAFAVRLNRAVHAGLQHYWSPEGADRYSLRVPFHENFILHVLGWVDFERFGLYEFIDYRRALSRGVGLCSQHAIVETGLLRHRGIPARIVRLDGHVVLEALVEPERGRWWVLDPDFGVELPAPLHELEADLGRVRVAYEAAGYSANDAAGIAAYYDAAGNMSFESVEDFAGPRRAIIERLTYLTIWLIPALLVVPFVLASLYAERETGRAAGPSGPHSMPARRTEP